MKNACMVMSLIAALGCGAPADVEAQTLEKVLITHSSDSVSITSLLYGMEKGFYRKEGIDLSFRVLRGELAVSAIPGAKEVAYIYGAGTAFVAAVRGVPLKIFSHDFKSVFFDGSRPESGLKLIIDQEKSKL